LPKYKINLAELSRKVASDIRVSTHRDKKKYTPEKVKPLFIDNLNTDLADIVDDRPMPLHPINNTIL
jgi:hypothetical protein